MNAKNIKRNKYGFTLVEAAIALFLFNVVVAAMGVAMMTAYKAWHREEVYNRAAGNNSMILQHMVYGVGQYGGLREAYNLVKTADAYGWSITYLDGQDQTVGFVYNPSLNGIEFTQTGQLLCSNVLSATFTPNSSTNGADISITLYERDGQFASTNTFSTYLSFRNTR